MADFKVNGITPHLGNIKYGSQNVQQIYKGSTLVWPFIIEGSAPECIDRVVVFQICNTNRVQDDNFRVYLNAFNWADVNTVTQADLNPENVIATIDQNCDTRCANLFIGSTDTSNVLSNAEWVAGTSYTEGDVVSYRSASSDPNEGSYLCIAATNALTHPDNDPAHWERLFDCPITLTTQHHFNPSLLRGGSNTLFFENVQRNCCGNGFELEVKNYLLDRTTGLLTDPLTIVDGQGVRTVPAAYPRAGWAMGTNLAVEFNFDSCGV